MCFNNELATSFSQINRASCSLANPLSCLITHFVYIRKNVWGLFGGLTMGYKHTFDSVIEICVFGLPK